MTRLDGYAMLWSSFRVTVSLVTLLAIRICYQCSK
jgi:hypothetical protein